MTLDLWSNIFVRIVQQLPPKSSMKTVREHVSNYFKNLSYDLVSSNPLLVFLNEDTIKNPKNVMAAFDKLIEFNQNFLNTVRGFETKHPNSYWSYLNISVPDHEMGLVNFPKQAAEVIGSQSRLPGDRPILCNAWQDLKHQQTARIRTSIGVGFATAVACGVGIWSGVGAVAAGGYCTLAIADGLWGARRGYLDAQTAQAALYAGAELLSDGTFSEGFLTPEQSATQRTQGHIVFLINILGLVPVGRAVASAGSGLRGSKLELFKLPGADLTVSTVESKAANIAYVLLTLRGSEAIQHEIRIATENMNTQMLGQYR